MKVPCFHCLVRPAVALHELTPRSAGGKLEPDNQIPLCNQCHDEVQADWRKWHGTLEQDKYRAWTIGIESEYAKEK